MIINTRNNGAISATSAKLRRELAISQRNGILTLKAERTYRRMIAKADKSAEAAQAAQRAAQKEKEVLKNADGISATLRVIGYIREAGNIKDAVYNWTGYNLDHLTIQEIQAILTTWENELTQNNYTKSAADDKYFEDNGYSINMEAAQEYAAY